MKLRSMLTVALLVCSMSGDARSQSLERETTQTPDEASRLDPGISLYEQGRFDEALTLFQQAVIQDGDSAPLHYWLGMARYKLGDYRAALSSFRKAVRQDRSWAPGHVGLGMAYLNIKNRRLDARNALRAAVRLDAGNADAQYYLGMSFMSKRKVDNIVGSDRDGRVYFHKAVELNPSHPDAFYQLGRCYDSPPGWEHEKAMDAYINQYRVNTEHQHALERFTNLTLRTEMFDRGADLLNQIVEEAGDEKTDEVLFLRSVFGLLSSTSEQQFDHLQEALETYISSLEPEDRAVFRDLSHVAPPRELDAWDQAEGTERDALWQAFWNTRDSNPATVENERLVEHYRRVLYAMNHFSEGQYPYDRRGEIYVRYGRPDDRRGLLMRRHETTFDVYRPSENPAVDWIRERNMHSGYVLQVGTGDPVGLQEEDIMQRQGFNLGPVDNWAASSEGGAFGLIKRLVGETYKVESWVYVPLDMELFFVDQMGGGKFDYPLQMIYEYADDTGFNPAFTWMRENDTYHPQWVASEQIVKAPEEYRHDFGGDPLEYAFDAVTFRGDGGKTELDLSYSIPVWQFGDATDGKGASTSLNHLVTLRDLNMSPEFTHEFGFGPFDRPQQKLAKQQIQVPVYTLPASVVAPTGEYMLAVQVKDQASGRIGVYKKPVIVDDYSGDELLISDLKLASGVEPSSIQGPFVRNRLRITPNPGRLYARGQLVYVYYEVYNLAMDDSGRTSYETLYEITPMGMPALRNRQARRPDDMQTVMSFFEGVGTEPEEAEYTALDTTDLEAGEYVLTVTLTDRHADRRVSKSVNFMVVEP